MIGYGGIVEVPTIEIISTERNVVGNIVGTYNDLAELMALAAQGKVTLHTKPYPLEAANDAMTTTSTNGQAARGTRGDSHPQLKKKEKGLEGTPEARMYEKDGERYFVVDGHMHFWDAQRGEPRRTSTARASSGASTTTTRNLSPEEYVWPLEKYRKYDEPT